jgi:hypothetical protein
MQNSSVSGTSSYPGTGVYSSAGANASSVSASSPVSAEKPSTATPSSTANSAPHNNTDTKQAIKSSALEAAAIILKSLSSKSAANPVSTDVNTGSPDTDTMDLSTNRLLQTLQPTSVLGKLPQVLLDTRVVQARVLQNTLLEDVAAPTQKDNFAATVLTGKNTTQILAQYRVTLALNLNGMQQTIDLALPAPLPQGKWVQVELRPNGTAFLRNTVAADLPQLTAREQQLQTGIKRALPLQQAPEQVIKRMMELIAQPTFSKLPPAIQQAVTTLRAQWPTPQQASDASTLQKALNNSGTFYETKLQQASIANPGATTTPAKTAANTAQSSAAQPSTAQAAEKNLQTLTDKPPANINATNGNAVAEETQSLLQTTNQSSAPLANDQKAITLELLSLIGQLVKKPAAVSDEKTELITQTELTYKKPMAATVPSALLSSENSDDAGLMLKELGRLLLATLARTQIHQLDSLQARQSSENPQAPTATWVLELPIQHGQRTDTLGLRIEQYASKKNTDPRATQWIVNLTLDLERLGQLQVQLKIRNQHVKATLWTEQHNTHRLVRKHVHELRQNFEKIGVMVDEIDVYQGLPDHVPTHAFQRRLIDVRT